MSQDARHLPPLIRPAKVTDYDEILRVWSAAGLSYRPGQRDSQEGFRRQVERFGDCYLVATDRGRVVGVILGTHDERKGWINRLAVLPEYRRRAVASALLKACESAIHSRGIEIITALVEESNTESYSFFQKMGYVCDLPVHYLRKLSHPEA